MRGSVFKRSRTWTAQVYLGRDPATGRKRYKQLNGFSTKRAAEHALTEQLERLRVGEYADPGATTVAEFIERWLTAVTPTVRPTTAASYRAMLERHVVLRVGTVKLAELTGLDLSSLYGELLVAGYGKGNKVRGLPPTTVRYLHRIVSHALRDAVRWGLLVRNPADQVDPPRAAHPEMTTWSAEQVRAFLDSVSTDRLSGMWVLLCTTGMRRGEVLGLRWEDMDLHSGKLAVRRALVEVAGYELHLSEPKTAGSRRSISLDVHTVTALGQHRRRQAEERLAAGIGGRAELVFTRPDGRALQPQNVSQTFASRTRQAGLPPIRLHDLRHSAATLALEAGIHPKVVAERLGHSTVQLTLDRYSHVVDGIQQAAAARIGQVIFGEPAPGPPAAAAGDITSPVGPQLRR